MHTCPRLTFEDMPPSHEGWVDNYYPMRDQVLWSLPWPVRVVVGQMVVYRSIKATLYG